MNMFKLIFPHDRKILSLFTFVSTVLIIFYIYIGVESEYDIIRVYQSTLVPDIKKKPSTNVTPTIVTPTNSPFLKFKVTAECDNKSSLVHFDTITVFSNISLNSSCLFSDTTGHFTVDEVRKKADDQFQLGTYKLQQGTWLINCRLPKLRAYQKPRRRQPIILWQTTTPLLNQWRTVFEQTSIIDNVTSSIIDGTTILIRRHEYANIYWTLVDVYDAVLLCTFLGLEPRDVNILLFDSHPYGMLDPFWDVFKTVYRARLLPGLTKFRNLIFTLPRSLSPLLLRDARYKFNVIPEFKTLVHSLHKETVYAFDKNRCKDMTFRILFIWRRDYSSRPNSNTTVSRKLRNEDEILSLSKLTFAKSQVIGIQLDQLSVTDQLRWISRTDILIGMHGAALAYSILLPRGAALIELLPNNWHMSYMAYHNDVHYISYKKKARTVGNDISRSVPPGDVTELIQQAIKTLCRI